MRDLGVGDRLDQYEIVDVLARSGMATVFKAVDQDSGRAVALKVPHAQYECDVAFHERFLREEEIGRRLEHPNVVRALAPREQTRMYLALEYVEGSSLRALLRASGPIAPERALSIARQLCGALAYLHRNGVVHRDVKPENVVLVPPEGAVKLLDFGIALLDSARRITWAGLSGTIGTPDYMAPEQVRGRRGDARTDVYAAGTILYEMLTGHLPFEADNVPALLRAKTHRDATSPRRHVRGIQPGLEAIVRKALARSPRERYATADEMLAELEDPGAAAARAAQERSDAVLRGPRALRARASRAMAAFAAGLSSLFRGSRPVAVVPSRSRTVDPTPPSKANEP
jgi:serine/threonine-protein kinase